jgi:ADP-heptose:LPS heptosyltransferase
LKNILPVCSAAGAAFFSIQKDLRAGDAEILSANPHITHLGTELNNFLDTAAVMQSLDLIISSDTSIVNLAGALGRPVWILLSANPDWRWLLDRADSPWYPTARLYRQRKSGDWDSVVVQVSADLTKALG